MKRDRLLTVLIKLKKKTDFFDINNLFQAEQKVAKRRKIEENRNLTLQTNHEDNQKLIPEIIEEKPQVTYYSLFEKQNLFPFFMQLLTSKGTNLLLLNDFTDLLPQKSSQESRTLLSSEELHRVETIQLSFEQRIELGQ